MFVYVTAFQFLIFVKSLMMAPAKEPKRLIEFKKWSGKDKSLLVIVIQYCVQAHYYVDITIISPGVYCLTCMLEVRDQAFIGDGCLFPNSLHPVSS